MKEPSAHIYVHLYRQQIQQWNFNYFIISFFKKRSSVLAISRACVLWNTSQRVCPERHLEELKAECTTTKVRLICRCSEDRNPCHLYNNNFSFKKIWRLYTPTRMAANQLCVPPRLKFAHFQQSYTYTWARWTLKLAWRFSVQPPCKL
jgi:hypothetical protein